MKGRHMLLGQYGVNVGDKGRIAFPKLFRELLGNQLIITQGYEKSLIVVSRSGWEALLEGTEGKPFIQAAARQTQRFLLGGASSISLDDKGRFVLPAYLRSFAGITTEVVFVGLSRYVEIWDKNRWDTYNITLAKNIDSIAKELLEGGET